VIEEGLKNITPDILIIGEEAAAEGRLPDLNGAEYFWLVDPLDGTKEFISGRGDYTVNIALIRNRVPIMGVVYAPVKGELYAGCGEGTAVKWSEDTGKDKKITVRTPPPAGLTVVASLHHGDAGRMEKFLSSYKIEKLIKRGSSLKICAVAAGKADVYPRLGPTCEWDTAAGDAVLRAAGGMITDLQGKDLVYGRQEGKFLNPEFIAAPAPFFTDNSFLQLSAESDRDL
jgi:3'(2'), 5'-bisphosphate nucleotidase